MNMKFWYMKILGFLCTLIGFSYCLTSFYNLFETILGNKIIAESSNVFVMAIGLVFPLFLFIFGVFFYFYADVLGKEKNKSVLSCIIVMFMVSIINILLSIININGGFLSDIIMLIHYSFGYVNLIISCFLLYGRIKYKY